MKKTRYKICMLMAAVLAAVLFCGLLLLKPARAFAAEDSAISSRCPDGSQNISLGKPVTASSSYEMPGEGWAASLLTDGKLSATGQTNGWSTRPGETTDPSTIAWATVDLQGEYGVTRIVLFPRGDLVNNYGESFPVNFQLQAATAAEGPWTDVYHITGFAKPSEPLQVDVENVSAQFVRLYVTGRTGVDNMTGGGGGNDGKLVQISEMAVFGKLLHATATLDKPALKLNLGASEQPKLTVMGMETPALQWTSEDSSIASVSAEGVITAQGIGTTNVHVSGEGIAEQTVTVTVVEKKFDFDENITISVFWLPTMTYLNGGEGDERWDEQFKLLQDADIDWLAHVTDNDNTGMLISSKEENLKAAKYADKYGMHLTVADTRFGRNLLTMSDEAIASLVGEYRNVPGVGGYYIWDEPAPTEDLTTFARVYADMKRADPDAYAHLNFLPLMAYGGEEAYRNHIISWLEATEAAGVEQDYIMYDFYPYTGFASEMDRDNFFSHLNAMRKIGLEYGVKTATYLQSNGSVNKRSPSPAEIRYQAMTSLAYGYKQLSYFTWFLPTNRGETFHDAIVDDNGVPNPKTYAAVSTLNREIHNLGRTLARLDSMEVYLNGRTYGNQAVLPDNFVFQSMDDVSYTVSLMKDKETGRNYVMLVNNDYNAAMQANVFLNYGIRSLQRVSPEDGQLKDVEIPSDGILEISLEAGDAVLFALPEGMDCTAEQTVDRTEADAVLTRAESEKNSLSEADAAALDGAVRELKEALDNVYYTQEHIDLLTERVREILDGATKVEQPPEKEAQKGCGCIVGAAAGGGIALGLLLAAILLSVRRRRD